MLACCDLFYALKLLGDPQTKEQWFHIGYIYDVALLVLGFDYWSVHLSASYFINIS